MVVDKYGCSAKKRESSKAGLVVVRCFLKSFVFGRLENLSGLHSSIVIPEKMARSGCNATVPGDDFSDRARTKEPLASYAAVHGLTQVSARPTLVMYLCNIWSRRHFVWQFASARNASMYTLSRLGQIWQVLTPLFNAGVYFLVFGFLLGARYSIPDYVPWLVCGVFVFSFTQRSITAGAKAIGANTGLIRALHFPRAVLPLAYTLVEFQHMIVAMGVLLVLLVGFGVFPTASWLLIIPLLSLQMIFNVGVSLIMARIGAFTRDITQLLPFALRTWLYASGVIFAVNLLVARSGTVRENPWIIDVLEVNPGYVYVELARQALIPDYANDHGDSHTSPPTPPSSMQEPGLLWVYAVVWAAVLLAAGFTWFYRAEDRYGRS
ncbi:ABC transporter permease [Actinomadura sp. NPDC023710]|uniref:ABC transporter permease n=1 Tax=Actinomadura sp. NPDC023710 TaxID=3158219 RepID=UPI003401351A